MQLRCETDDKTETCEINIYFSHLLSILCLFQTRNPCTDLYASLCFFIFVHTSTAHSNQSLLLPHQHPYVNKWNEKPCVVGCAANLFELRPTLVVSNVPRLAYVTSRAAASVASPIGRPNRRRVTRTTTRTKQINADFSSATVFMALSVSCTSAEFT